MRRVQPPHPRADFYHNPVAPSYLTPAEAAGAYIPTPIKNPTVDILAFAKIRDEFAPIRTIDGSGNNVTEFSANIGWALNGNDLIAKRPAHHRGHAGTVCGP